MGDVFLKPVSKVEARNARPRSQEVPLRGTCPDAEGSYETLNEALATGTRSTSVE